ncbi:probable two-component response regulator [Pseudoalteromonas luteoviolacea B = ATCC 29581]|nr:probable two-component response regulator [Pseudoalteromonas luteoviolacea B = ATCC 29581]
MFNDVNDLSDCTILLVEDSPINQKVIQCCLEDICEIVTFASAEEAIEYCLQTPPDIILMDWILDGMSGVQACQLLQKEPTTANIPIIFVTSNTSEHQQEECWDAGGVDFIGKPIVARTLVNRVRTHLKYKKQADVLREYSYVDGLTGVYNRRYFEQELERFMRQSQRTTSSLSLIILDVDFFKKYNDYYGHLEGDDVLKSVAQTLQKNTRRPLDCAFRYGGEEFAVLLPNTPVDSAVKIAENIIQDIHALAIEHTESPMQVVTASAGVADNHSTNETDTLINLADKALYAAKHSGRNQVKQL